MIYCVCMRTCVCVYACACVYMRMRMFMCVHACVCVCVRVPGNRPSNPKVVGSIPSCGQSGIVGVFLSKKLYSHCSSPPSCNINGYSTARFKLDTREYILASANTFSSSSQWMLMSKCYMLSCMIYT